jgi:CheY-like chemotaxis protein
MKKILIVDDSQFMRNVIKDTLAAKNNDAGVIDKLEFFEADGKDNAIKQVHLIKPDLILLDIVMKESEMEGIEFLENIKSSFNLNNVIMISSIGQMEIIEKCKNLGIKAYLQKPIDSDQLLEAVNHKIKELST